MSLQTSQHQQLQGQPLCCDCGDSDNADVGPGGRIAVKVKDDGWRLSLVLVLKMVMIDVMLQT